MFWFRLNILCRVSGYRGHVVRRDLSCEIFRLGKRISERCAVPRGVLIIPADGTHGQGLDFNLGSRDGRHQGLYLQGGEVGSGSRFLGRRNRFGRSGARSPGRPILRFGPLPTSSRRFAPLLIGQFTGRLRPLVLAPFDRGPRGSIAATRGETPDRTSNPPACRDGFEPRPRPRPFRERSIPCSWL